jgi:hypothetical protein
MYKSVYLFNCNRMNQENVFVENEDISHTRVISIDVGIKNLAYCIIDVDVGIKILDWAIVNLMEETPIQDIPCGCISNIAKSPKKCEKRAKFHKNSIFFCQLHANKCKEWVVPNKTNTASALRKKSIPELVEFATAHNITLGDSDTKHTKRFLTETIISEVTARKFDTLTTSKVSNSREIDLITIGRNIKKMLDAIPLIMSVTHVLIENQIGPLALRMKSVQGLLSQYFIMRLDSIPVIFVSSSNKLKHLPVIDTISNEDTKGKKYKQHKSDAVLHTQNIIDENIEFSEWNSLFSLKITKKDDYADCFLQALWWFVSNNIVVNDGYKYRNL